MIYKAKTTLLLLKLSCNVLHNLISGEQICDSA